MAILAILGYFGFPAATGIVQTAQGRANTTLPLAPFREDARLQVCVRVPESFLPCFYVHFGGQIWSILSFSASGRIRPWGFCYFWAAKHQKRQTGCFSGAAPPPSHFWRFWKVSGGVTPENPSFLARPGKMESRRLDGRTPLGREPVKRPYGFPPGGPPGGPGAPAAKNVKNGHFWQKIVIFC